MPTDEERREVARRLRETKAECEERGYPWMCDDLILALGYDHDYEAGDEIFDRLADLIEPQPITGDTSDGYHTFDELYDHRARLFSVVVRDYREIAWKSRLHRDGTMYDGMFIVGVETPQGQATYHYDIDPYWDIFDCKELVRAPEWDGHTPEQAISRIASLRPSCDLEALLALADEMDAEKNFVLVGGYARRIREALGVPDERTTNATTC
ncbi:MAG TPA: hypothetical protein IAA15_02610 [Candidatus Olsenella pullicola]|nr:hypothetical protein [Candidatus Olsenella pullicola]